MIQPFDPNPHLRWLFCMTHPDDEISICAWIKRLTSHGNQVFMSWTHHLPVREAEARESAKLLGVPQENLIFHGATDGRAAFEVPHLLPEFEKMVRQIQPDRIACGAFEQGHIDHDTTHFLVTQALKKAEKACIVLDIPFYHTYASKIQKLNRFADPTGETILDLSHDEQLFKKKIAQQYPSQNIYSILRWYETCHRLLARPSKLAQTERMRVSSFTDYLTPNLPTHLAERVRQTKHWKNWIEAMNALDNNDEK